MERELERDLAVLLEAVRAARCELAGLRDPQRNTTAERVVRRLSSLLEGEEIKQAMTRLGTERLGTERLGIKNLGAKDLETDDSPPLVPADHVDLRVPYPWRAH